MASTLDPINHSLVCLTSKVSNNSTQTSNVDFSKESEPGLEAHNRTLDCNACMTSPKTSFMQLDTNDAISSSISQELPRVTSDCDVDMNEEQYHSDDDEDKFSYVSEFEEELFEDPYLYK